MRDQRRDIQLLHSLGWSYPKITKHIDTTKQQVQYACQGLATPRKCEGRPPKLNAEQVQQLVEFVTASKIGWRMFYSRLATTLNFECGEHTIQFALKKEGFNRRIA